MNLAKQWTTDPAIVEIESQNVASDTVEQHIYAVAGADKYKLLFNLINDNDWDAGDGVRQPQGRSAAHRRTPGA